MRLIKYVLFKKSQHIKILWFAFVDKLKRLKDKYVSFFMKNNPF